MTGHHDSHFAIVLQKVRIFQLSFWRWLYFVIPAFAGIQEGLTE